MIKAVLNYLEFWQVPFVVVWSYYQGFETQIAMIILVNLYFVFNSQGQGFQILLMRDLSMAFSYGQPEAESKRIYKYLLVFALLFVTFTASITYVFSS